MILVRASEETDKENENFVEWKQEKKKIDWKFRKIEWILYKEEMK